MTRWRCPVCAGLLRTPSLPNTMRRSRRAPLVQLPEGCTSCCRGTLSAPPAELPLTQRIPFGTTAWRISMHRRQVVESANAGLKGAFADLSRGFFRVFGRVKISVLLGFTIAAYNLDRVRSFRARQAEGEHRPKHRAKWRLGIWRDLIDLTAEAGPEDDRAPPS